MEMILYIVHKLSDIQFKNPEITTVEIATLRTIAKNGFSSQIFQKVLGQPSPNF